MFAVSRTRCSVLPAMRSIVRYAALQSRDPWGTDGPRISSAPRRKGGALRSTRGTRLHARDLILKRERLRASMDQGVREEPSGVYDQG